MLGYGRHLPPAPQSSQFQGAEADPLGTSPVRPGRVWTARVSTALTLPAGEPRSTRGKGPRIGACRHTRPQTGWPGTMEVYSLTAPEAGSLKSRCAQGRSRRPGALAPGAPRLGAAPALSARPSFLRGSVCPRRPPRLCLLFKVTVTALTYTRTPSAKARFQARSHSQVRGASACRLGGCNSTHDRCV